MAFEELTSRHAVMWGSAPFENIAHLISDMHVALVERLAPVPASTGSISDVAPAMSPSSRRAPGRTVTGSDLSPDAGRDRATARREPASISRSRSPTAQNLHYEDASFDVVSSSVGVIFAPDHERVAHELARVCRPGGRVGLTAWRKESGIGEMFDAMAPYMPAPPPGAGSPFQWGDEAYVGVDAR